MSSRGAEGLRYLLNGALATLVHFVVLWACLEWLRVPSAGLSSAAASLVGIAVSFFGNRHFVFRRQDGAMWPQARRFLMLYAAIALLHGSVLFVWTDILHLPYMAGFGLAVALQVVLGYLGGRFLVFAPDGERNPSVGS